MVVVIWKGVQVSLEVDPEDQDRVKVQDRTRAMDPADMRVLASEGPVGGERKALVLGKSTLLATSATKFCLAHWAMDLAFKAKCKGVLNSSSAL